MEGVSEEPHKEEIAEERDETAGEMEAKQLREWVAAGCGGPGVMHVPDEVVKERELDGEG